MEIHLKSKDEQVKCSAYISTAVICSIFVHIIIKIIPLRADSTPGN